MTRIAIDLNVRVRGNLTYSGYEDIDGELPEDGVVEVYEPEAGLIGSGRVVDRDDERQLVYLQVEWASLSARPAAHDAVPGNGVVVHYMPTFGGHTVPLAQPMMPGTVSAARQLTA